MVNNSHLPSDDVNAVHSFADSTVSQAALQKLYFALESDYAVLKVFDLFYCGHDLLLCAILI